MEKANRPEWGLMITRFVHTTPHPLGILECFLINTNLRLARSKEIFGLPWLPCPPLTLCLISATVSGAGPHFAAVELNLARLLVRAAVITLWHYWQEPEPGALASARARASGNSRYVKYKCHFIALSGGVLKSRS